MRAVGLLITGVIAVWFFYGAVYDVANHYLSFDPGKVSNEFSTTMLFAAGGLLLSGAGALGFVHIWEDRG